MLLGKRQKSAVQTRSRKTSTCNVTQLWRSTLKKQGGRVLWNRDAFWVTWAIIRLWESEFYEISNISSISTNFFVISCNRNIKCTSNGFDVANNLKTPFFKVTKWVTITPTQNIQSCRRHCSNYRIVFFFISFYSTTSLPVVLWSRFCTVIIKTLLKF